jgi:hypothetical protein
MILYLTLNDTLSLVHTGGRFNQRRRKIMTETTHARYSPSSLEPLELCPCFRQNESGDRSASDAGTRMHKAVETRDVSICADQEEEDAVTRAVEFENDLLHSTGARNGRVLREYHLNVEDITRGTGDLLILVGQKATLVDWKFGRVPVAEASDNVQMQGYVLGVFHSFPEIEDVDVYIVGPRMDFLSMATYKRSDCDAIRKRILAIVKACEDPDKVPNADERCCRYCGIKATCPRLLETAVAVTRNLGLPLPVEFEAGRIVRPEDRAKAQVLSYILEDWGKQVREYNAKAVLEDGIVIPGFEIRSRKGNITVVDIVKAIERVTQQFDLSLDSIHQACTLSVPKLSDQLYATLQSNDVTVDKKSVRDSLVNALEGLVSEAETVTFLQRKRGKSNEDIIKECK